MAVMGSSADLMSSETSVTGRNDKYSNRLKSQEIVQIQQVQKHLLKKI